MSSLRTAPGSDGVPLAGETLSFVKNPFRFLEERLAKHGRIFRSHLLGRKTIVIAGADAAGRFIDTNMVMREGAMPPHVQELFGGRSLPLLDGDVHKTRKRASSCRRSRARRSRRICRSFNRASRTISKSGRRAA